MFGLGAVSVATDTDIISVPGLGQGPGVTGMLIALMVFAVMLGLTLRRPHPAYVASLAISLSTALGHLVGVWTAVLIGTGGLVTATAVAGDLVRGGPSVALIVAAAIAAWSGIALRRTRSARPRWRWERDEEE